MLPQKKPPYLTIMLLFIAIAMTACGGNPEADLDETIAHETSNASLVVWVDSYHASYPWSAAIERGLRKALGDAAALTIIHLDTKNNPDEDFCQAEGQTAYADIMAMAPDVVIVTDDNAQRCLVVPHLMDSDLPIVFGGVNWDASIYGYPNDHITGMIEVDLVVELANHLSAYADGDRIGYIGPDNTTDRKSAAIYNERFFDDTMQVSLVSTYDDFKEAFIALQDDVDMIIIGNNAGIEGWDDNDAQAFLLENTHIPTGSLLDFLSPYVLITLARIGEEQGEWTAATALSIIDGTPITDIPVVENEIGWLILNMNFADRLDVTFSVAMLRNADAIYDMASED